MLPLKNGQIRAIRFNYLDMPAVTHFLSRHEIKTGLPVFEDRCCLSPDDQVVRMSITNGFHPSKLAPANKSRWDALPLVEVHAPLTKI